MKEFPDLRSFLLLKEDHSQYPRSVHCDEPFDKTWRMGKSKAEEMILRYDIAKRSWESWGDAGPTEGSYVTTLRSGFGGRPGRKLVFGGEFVRDARCFVLNDPKDLIRCYIVMKKEWWIDIKVFEDTDHDII